MKDIIKIKYNVTSERDSLKLKLEQKELVEYYNWKSKDENASSREAMDKVVAKLKLEDTSWLLEEERLIELKNKATLVGNIYEVLLANLNHGMSLELVERLGDNYIDDFKLGEYL